MSADQDRSSLDELRPPPSGLPAPDPRPPVVAESGDPFATLRVIDLVARIPRGRPIPIGDLVDLLNATYLDWLFDERVVADALLQLQSNWMADYRSAAGLVLDEQAGRTTVSLEDSTRVDPWIVRQAEREAARCREALLEFSRRDRLTTGG